ncbi:MaoC family dehydratase [Brevundimonas vesicularis]|uniref:MaoC family dehydratase n=1 Tax=Brevundimonas vesicularis TaxID=41276 RepID=UPI0038D4BD56
MVELVSQHPSGGYILDELHVGMAAEKIVHVSEERIRLFAEASDDFNPVHLDEAFAAKTAYRGRIAHGLLSAAFGSAVVGTILPGAGSIYISQTLEFHFPVRIGDDVRIRITVVELEQDSARAQLKCEGFVGDRLIMDGLAVVRVPRRRKPSAR